MFKKYEQYYFDIPKSETFKPQFPKEFDTLVVINQHQEEQDRNRILMLKILIAL